MIITIRQLFVLSLLALTASSLSAQSLYQSDTHVADLRRELKLSSDLKLEWLTSSSGSDTIRVTDDFNRTEILPNWSYDSRYWQIVDGELWLTPAAIYEWRYLAVFNAASNQPGRAVYSVSYRWGKSADAVGIREGAHALMIDEPSEYGSGYWLWHRNNWNQVWLWIINGGTWEYYPREGKSVDQQYAHANPVAGDVITAYIRQQPEAVYFDYYVNQEWDATLRDTTKEFPKDNIWYTGVFLHGEQLNNQVDDFTITWLQADSVPPAAVTDLRAIDNTTNKVTLQWTMTGDNGNAGRATSIEIRYATWAITPENFSTAILASNMPRPSNPGETQAFAVTGLQPDTHYYFAMRVFDEAANGSDLSNVVEGFTKRESVARQLVLVSGCGQNGEVGSTLARPLVAEVKDQNDHPFPGHPVEFTVRSGDAYFEGASSITVVSGTDGTASATLRLGTIPGEVQLEILASGLEGSPIACSAVALPGKPSQVTIVSGNSQLVTAGSEAAPLIAKIEDCYQNPLVSWPVSFHVISGGGRLQDRELLTMQLQVLSDSLGQAAARLVTSPVYGEYTTITVTPDSAASNSVRGTFVVASAAPDSITLVSGNQQTAVIGTMLPLPLVVRLYDQLGATLVDYPVSFSVMGSSGSLGAGGTQVTITTDSTGLAATNWTLGTQAGPQQVIATAKFAGSPLRNAPLTFAALGLNSDANSSFSTLKLISAATVIADSQAAAAFEIKLVDGFGNPVAGEIVELLATGSNNYLNQPAGPTDALGIATTEMRSTRAERKVVRARLVSESLTLQDSVVVQFQAGPAAQLRTLLGDQQSGRVGSVLPEPVAIRATDRYGNAVLGGRAVFEVVAGGGRIIGESPVATDSEGVAEIRWQLGPVPGLNRLAVHLSGSLIMPVEFVATAVDSITAVAESRNGEPRAFELLPNYPNPFNPTTMIEFHLPEAAWAEISIYDLVGRQITILIASQLAAGEHRVWWNGEDREGQRMAAGLYIYSLRAHLMASGKDMMAKRKLALVK